MVHWVQFFLQRLSWHPPNQSNSTSKQLWSMGKILLIVKVMDEKREKTNEWTLINLIRMRLASICNYYSRSDVQSAKCLLFKVFFCIYVCSKKDSDFKIHLYWLVLPDICTYLQKCLYVTHYMQLKICPKTLFSSW